MNSAHTNGSSKHPDFDIGEILKGCHLAAYFQPIVSVWNKSLVGYEGLIRGKKPSDSRIIPPIDLFEAAKTQGKLWELDQLCHKRILVEFSHIRQKDPAALLTLNFEPSVIDGGQLVASGLLQQVKQAGLKPESIALEIVESNVKDLDALQEFVRAYRDQGFLISLDDIGIGYSNLNRITLLKPDILKIDHCLVKNIQSDYYKQEVFKSLVSLARKIGAILIAEGVEEEAEAIACLVMGADMIQGYYFSKPKPMEELDAKGVLGRLGTIGEKYKHKAIEQLNAKLKSLHRYEAMTKELQETLSLLEAPHFDLRLTELIHFFPQVDSIYVLDENGLQISEAILGIPEKSRRNPDIFRPPLKGSNHSLKDYYYVLMESKMGKNTFLSDPCLSMATGNMCVTFAHSFQDASNKRHILCVDINTEFLQKLSPLE